MAKTVEKDFIDDLIKSQCKVSIFLINGMKMSGVMITHDSSSVILCADGYPDQLIYKQIIATISKYDNYERRPFYGRQ